MALPDASTVRPDSSKIKDLGWELSSFRALTEIKPDFIKFAPALVKPEVEN